MTEIKPDGSAWVDVESVQDAAMSDDARLVIPSAYRYKREQDDGEGE